jgi:hypothetical protein
MQKLVLSFFGAASLALVAILIGTPAIYDEALKLPPGDHRLVDAAFLVALTIFLGVLSIGVIRRWRWTFWLILIAFIFGILRVPASALALLGVNPTSDPPWYLLFQAVIGLVQFGIGLAMLDGYRRSGVWGLRFRRIDHGREEHPR